MRRRRLAAFVGVLGSLSVISICGASADPALAAAPSAPAWKVLQSSEPTTLVPGSEATTTAGTQYTLVVTNVGGAPVDSVTITDTLPAGISPSPSATPRYKHNNPCAVSGQTVVCTVAEQVNPGESIEINIPIAVALDAGPTVSNEVTVESEGAQPTSRRLESSVNSAIPPFGLVRPGLFPGVFDQAGGQPLAGSHPFVAMFDIETTSKDNGSHSSPVESLRSVSTSLPEGFVVNPQATPERCTVQQLSASAVTFPSRYCPAGSQVGISLLGIPGLGRAGGGIYNMVPPPGAPAELAFEAENSVITIIGGLSGDFRLTTESSDLLGRFETFQVDLVLWGDPSDPRHDYARVGEGCEHGCAVETASAPFVSMPTACHEPMDFTAEARSWLGSRDEATVPFSDRDGNPLEVNGCNALEFEPTISAKATTNLADSPSGLDFNLHQPQNQQLDGLATAALKNTTVTLPAGMTLNAAAANGLNSCTESQIGYTPREGKIRFATTPQSCPNAAKLGILEVKSPLLDHKLPGAVYLARPYENPFGNLTAIYLAIEDEETGIVTKLAGKVTPDPTTGQLSATFTESPQLPLEDIDLHFFNGDGAALTTPLTCGTKTTTSTLTPWSSPEGADVHPSDSFATQVAAGGSGNCPSSEASAPNKPSFTAGTIAPEAGAYSPFVLKLARPDGTQRLTAIDTLLPNGLAAKFAGIPYCSEAQIAQAQSRSNPNQGALEQASPSCPAASEVGTVTVGAGSGPTPTYVSGHAYLAGPYKGAPLSLAIITPAVAGPFDLGAVVVRTAIYIDPETAQGHAVSDPLPSILQGIPLDIRSVAIKLDRPGGFTLNPTSCDPMSIVGAATALTGQSAALTSPFQVGGCNALKFKPKLAISLKGGTKRHSFPALKAVLTYPKGNYANIASAQVTLPHSAFLEQGHIGTVCTRVQFAASACPKASIYGKARAITPLLDKPLEGPVYLRSSSHELPDLVAALNGQIDVDLAGRVDTGKGGGIRNTFEAVPDAPVSKFVLEMQGGKKGLLVNSENICRKTQKASVSFTAQNGAALQLTPTIKNSCGGKAKKKGSHSKKGGKGK